MDFKQFKEPDGIQDPVGYASGYFIGRFRPVNMQAETLEGDTPCDVAFRSGFFHGQAVRENKRPIPPWDDGEPEKIFDLLQKKQISPPQMVARFLRQAVEADLIPYQLKGQAREVILKTADKMASESLSYDDASRMVAAADEIHRVAGEGMIVTLGKFSSPFLHPSFSPGELDGLAFFCGYLAGLTDTIQFSRESRPLPPILKYEEDGLVAGFAIGRAVRDHQQEKPDWHPAGLEAFVVLLSHGIIALGQARQMLHEAAKESGHHDCAKCPCGLPPEDKQRLMQSMLMTRNTLKN